MAAEHKQQEANRSQRTGQKGTRSHGEAIHSVQGRGPRAGPRLGRRPEGLLGSAEAHSAVTSHTDMVTPKGLARTKGPTCQGQRLSQLLRAQAKGSHSVCGDWVDVRGEEQGLLLLQGLSLLEALLLPSERVGVGEIGGGHFHLGQQGITGVGGAS